MDETPVPLQHLQHYSALYDLKRMSRLRLEPRRHDWPAWCYLPLSVLSGAMMDQARGRIDLSHKIVAAGLIADLANLGALLAWRQTQGIYRVDPTIYTALWDTPLDKDLPSSVFYHMPEWCVWIETPQDAGDKFRSRGFFAYLEHDIETGMPELRIVLDSTNSGRVGLVNYGVHLDQKTLKSALDAYLAQSLQNAVKAQFVESKSELQEHLKILSAALMELIKPRLSLLIYLCSVNAEISDRRGSGRRPRNPASKRTKRGLKEIPASTPTHWDVGVRLGAALRAAERLQAPASAGGTHASPRAHIRRAHWHSFWTGPHGGDRHIRVKWLPPIPVNVEDASDLIPTIRKVSD